MKFNIVTKNFTYLEERESKHSHKLEKSKHQGSKKGFKHIHNFSAGELKHKTFLAEKVLTGVGHIIVN